MSMNEGYNRVGHVIMAEYNTMGNGQSENGKWNFMPRDCWKGRARYPDSGVAVDRFCMLGF